MSQLHKLELHTENAGHHLHALYISEPSTAVDASCLLSSSLLSPYALCQPRPRLLSVYAATTNAATVTGLQKAPHQRRVARNS